MYYVYCDSLPYKRGTEACPHASVPNAVSLHIWDALRLFVSVRNGTTQYTNVLVGFTDEQVDKDLIMRSYMILSKDGEQLALYGGEVQRSLGYVAYQNRAAFQPGTAAYEYVWALIRLAYGDTYDAEYQG